MIIIILFNKYINNNLFNVIVIILCQSYNQKFLTLIFVCITIKYIPYTKEFKQLQYVQCLIYIAQMSKIAM